MTNTDNVGNDNGIIPAGTIVYKKCRSAENATSHDGPRRVIVKLIVLEEGIVPISARRSGASRKCRIPKGYVSEIFVCADSRLYQRGSRRTVAYSIKDRKFRYKVGSIVTPKQKFNKDPEIECTSGIHVYRTLQEAIDH